MESTTKKLEFIVDFLPQGQILYIQAEIITFMFH